MTQQEVWDLLANLKIGTVVAWLLVLAAIVAAIWLVIKKLFQWFHIYQTLKNEKTKTEERIKRHDVMLDKIVQSQEDQNRFMLQIVRSNIIVICQNAISAGRITDVQLRELTELYEQYEKNNGNSYASILMAQVRQLPVVRLLSDETK